MEGAGVDQDLPVKLRRLIERENPAELILKGLLNGIRLGFLRLRVPAFLPNLRQLFVSLDDSL